MPPRKDHKKRESIKKSEQWEERTFVNPSALSPHLFCPICQEPFCNPQRAPCGHSFCKMCIDPWISSNPICPVDRKPIAKGSMHHDFIVENIIGDYTVACPWRALGCDFIGPLHLLPSHKKSCVMNPGSMPPALQAHSNAYLNRVNNIPPLAEPKSHSVKINFVLQQPATTIDLGEGSSSSGDCNSLSYSASLNCSDNVANNNDDSVMILSDEEANLPPAPPPSLLFRLYQNSDSNCRDLLCNFLENTPEIPPVSTNKRRRKGH